MNTNKKETRHVKTTKTVFDIIDTVLTSEEPTIPVIANELDLARSTVHGHLTTLESQGLMTKDGREYRLSFKFLKYGLDPLERLDVLPIAEPVIENLADETGDTVWLSIREGYEYVLVAMAGGNHAVQTKGKLGARFPIHAGAIGKVFLAHMDDSAVNEYIESQELEAFTQNTITDPDELRDSLETIRDTGIAFSDGEITEGIRGVAAPVVVDELIAVIYLSGPARRLSDSRYKQEIPNLVRGATQSIQLQMEYE